MNIFYLLSGLGSRIFNLLMFVALSYLLSVEDFGRFSLVAGNAMLMHLVISGWIASALWRDASQAHCPDQAEQSNLATSHSLCLGAIFAALYAGSAGLAFFLIEPAESYLAIIPALAALTIFNEILLVALNAQHLPRSYGLLSFLRGALCLICAVALVLSGFGLWGAIAALFLGMLAAMLLLPDARHMFAAAWAERGLGNNLPEKLHFGVISVLALNLYMLGTIITRNLIAVQVDVAHAGFYSLAADIFYAPIALFATSLSLSSIPGLYRDANDAGLDAQQLQSQRQSAGHFILANLAVAIPYAIGGAWAAPLIVQLMLDADTAVGVAPIASYAVVQAAAFVIISTITTLLLTRGKTGIAVGVSIGLIVVLIAMAVSAPASLQIIAAYAAAALLLCAFVAFLLALWLGIIRIAAADAIKIALSASAMLPGLWISGMYLHGWLALIGMILLGTISYLATGWILNSAVIKGLLRFHKAAIPSTEGT